VISQAFSDQSNRRRSASQELRDQVSHLSWDAFMLDHQLKKVLDILNDIRTRNPAVSKGLEKTCPLNSSLSTAGSPPTGCSIRCGFRNTTSPGYICLNE
jgi:hypothetical protein